MKQLVQSLKSGSLELIEVPSPRNLDKHVLVRTKNTLISSGTERSLLEFGKAGYVGKARLQPDKVKQTIDKVKSDGIIPTLEAVNSKLDEIISLGYCNVGYVEDSLFPDIRVGSRVASNGSHAEVVRVPGQLCAIVPNEVSDEQAAFVVVSSIALQAVRLISPSLGENIGVVGCGLLGQLCVQLLLANGSQVLAVDKDISKCYLAQSSGAGDICSESGPQLANAADMFTNGKGLDGVIIAASTSSNEVIHDAAEICRQRGRIVLLGSVGLQLRRDDFYKKELSFRVSSSYGPGRYDPIYEIQGHDYPLPFVRWTAQRNFESVLNLMATGRLNVDQLISERFPLNNAVGAYSRLGDSNVLGIILNYPEERSERLLDKSVSLLNREKTESEGHLSKPIVGVIGCGSYASRVLLPTLSKLDVVLDTLIIGEGISGIRQGRKHQFRQISTDISSLWIDNEINTIIIASRHNRHAGEVIKALKSGKHVFVEKPLAISQSEIDEIEGVMASLSPGQRKPLLMVDFNRRFAPLVVEMKKQLDTQTRPKSLIYTVNAGVLPPEHWAIDPKQGGGRIISEVCHFIDLTRYLIGSAITTTNAISTRKSKDGNPILDEVSISLEFLDGSIATIHYLANGSRKFPKERLEVFCAGGILQLDNFRTLRGMSWPGLTRKGSFRQDKGNRLSVKAFIDAITAGDDAPIPFRELLEVSRATIKISNSLQSS